MERHVTLTEVLQARETRAAAQKTLLSAHGLPVISFCLNIAGPVKNSPVLHRAFQEGLCRLDAALTAAGLTPVDQAQIDPPTGCEALWVVQGSGRQVKELCLELEDADPLGRLFDLDVLEPGHGMWSRSELGRLPRRCLVCGAEGKGCASRRLHSVEQLQAATNQILRDFFAAKDRKVLSATAARSLLYEVCVTPKPGLVDRANCGSHRDMDLFTFLDSTAALLPYLENAVSIGQRTADQPPEETFRLLRRAGLRAEREMFRATAGVNTHKGAIFSLGTVCAAAGRLWTPEGPCRDISALLDTCAAMTAAAVTADLDAITPENANTTGKKLFLELGLTGIRGELAAGLPAVAQVGLPTLRDALASGATLEQAGVAVLIRLMAQVTDTNLIARGGPEGQAWAAAQARALLADSPYPGRDAVSALDGDMIARNLSPGGCADLLAITFFLHFCTSQ